MTEKERMLKGLIYDPMDEELVGLKVKCHKLCYEYNNSFEDEIEKRENILKEMGIKLGNNVYLQGPIYFDYGCHISMDDNSYANFNFTILDTCTVTIGKNVFFGPGVYIMTPIHPLRGIDRQLYKSSKGYYTDKEYGKPVMIEDNVWVAANVTICGGVTIGHDTVIGAGSVVTRSIPAGVFACGNPCKVKRAITEEDKIDSSLL